MIASESQLEEQFIEKLCGLKYEHRPDIRDRAGLEKNFREKFQALNRVQLTDDEFQRLLEEIITPDVFTAARILRERNSFIREDGMPLNYTLVNIKDWCKNTFEVANQLRINTDNSHHRYGTTISNKATAADTMANRFVPDGKAKAIDSSPGVYLLGARGMPCMAA